MARATLEVNDPKGGGEEVKKDVDENKTLILAKKWMNDDLLFKLIL